MNQPQTAKEIRDALKGEGRVYIRELFTATPQRVFDARERKGETQVKCGAEGLWHTLLNGDEVWSV